MKKLWYSIKTIIYSYLIQYLSIFISLIIYLLLNKNPDVLKDINTIYRYTIVGITITLIPLSIYLYRKYKIGEPKIEINKLIMMIPLGMSISLFYNMLTINLQPEKKIIGISMLVIVLYTVILGPIFEELVFRYVSLRKAIEKYGKKKAILLISIVFALLHNGIISMVYAFLIGLVLSYVYIKSKNIIYPMVLHISANLMSIFIYEFTLWGLIISIISLLLCIIYLRRIKFFNT